MSYSPDALGFFRPMAETQQSRVEATGEAADLLRRLTEVYGPVMFHQSGGCCFLIRSRLMTQEELRAFSLL